jgi:phospholipase DDHD2
MQTVSPRTKPTACPNLPSTNIHTSSLLPNLAVTKLLDTDKEGNIEHLVLIVHGIGEMLRSNDVFGLSLPNLSSIIDCCGHLRRNHAEVQDAHFSQMYPTADAVSRESTGRVEYIPVEWHEAFSILSQRCSTSSDAQRTPNVMLKDISLRTIPNMRDFANDTLMDVLYFMSPVHHDIIIDIVTNEMNTVVEMFCRLTGFTGRISVVGHSLGSIISWDILGNQNIDIDVDGGVSSPLQDGISSLYGSSLSGSEYGSTRSEDDHPELTPGARASQVPSAYPQLDFAVDNFFLLGSPVAVFLMIRNQRQPLAADFHLSGCNRVFNIFHPYDPIAYRIEPCIDPRNADFEPKIVKHWNGGFRVQYQTKRLWRKFVDSTWKTQQTVVEAFEASMAGMGLLDTAGGLAAEDEDDAETEFSSDEHNRGNVCGLLNRGRRIDYMLQEHEVENANEYVAALGAHSSYWLERDLSLFFARQSKFLKRFFHCEHMRRVDSHHPPSLLLQSTSALWNRRRRILGKMSPLLTLRDEFCQPGF